MKFADGTARKATVTGTDDAVDRTISAPNGFTVAHAVQTDATLNPGNSGGPLLNAKGEVVGIVDQIATDGNAAQSSGVGFAVPIDLVKSQLSTLEAGQKVQHAYLGVATSDAPNQTGGAAIGVVTTTYNVFFVDPVTKQELPVAGLTVQNQFTAFRR